MQTIAVLGYGGRGKNYATILRLRWRSQAKVIAVIDHNPDKLRVAGQDLNLGKEALFADYDDFLAKKIKADWLFVCTQDRDHLEHTMKALDAGYHILLEKPISPDVKECLAIEQKAKEKGLHVAVCHVLRYTGFYNRVKEVLDSGVLGDLISLEMQEDVGYWHQAHSFVRGDWRNTAESAPMIFAKCCHDLDLAVYLTNSQCQEISSVGQLNHFKAEKAPKGAAKRCVDCSVADCPYDARVLYLKRFKKIPRAARKYAWPMTRLVSDALPTMPKLEEAVREGQFGRCVYHCDNDVVDYQVAQMRFANGINATLTMTAFSHEIYRTILVRGTRGQLEGKFEDGKFQVRLFGKKPKTYKTSMGAGHGGGDLGLIRALIAQTLKTDISQSIESHVMAYAAEQSRLNGGTPVDVTSFKQELANKG